MEGCKAGDGFEAFGKVVGIEKGVEVPAELVVVEVVIGADGGLFDGALHALDLAIGPRVIGFGQAVIDPMIGTGQFEGMGAKEFAALSCQLDVLGCGTGVSRRGEVGAVVSEDGMGSCRGRFGSARAGNRRPRRGWPAEQAGRRRT